VSAFYISKVTTVIANYFDYIIELKDAVINSLDLAVFPHCADSVEQFADVAAILLEVQQITQVEATDALVLLVEFQWRYFFLAPPLRRNCKNKLQVTF
jgi:uncharacterized membrane protein